MAGRILFIALASFVVLIAIFIASILGTRVAEELPDDSMLGFCTQDAKLCPGGTYVGRVPPSCEFAACPAGTSTPQSGSHVFLTTELGQPASRFGVTITPLEVIEDSRCPLGAVCPHAGTVRVRALLQRVGAGSDQLFILNAPVTTGGEVITLVTVNPQPVLGGIIQLPDYRFVFEVRKR